MPDKKFFAPQRKLCYCCARICTKWFIWENATNKTVLCSQTCLNEARAGNLEAIKVVHYLPDPKAACCCFHCGEMVLPHKWNKYHFGNLLYVTRDKDFDRLSARFVPCYNDLRFA